MTRLEATMAGVSPGAGTGSRAASAGYWILVGALGSFGIVGLMTIGIFFLAGAVALAVLGAALKIDARVWPAAPRWGFPVRATQTSA